MLVGLDRGGADQHRLAVGVARADVVDHRLVALLGGPVDLVVLVLADHRPVGRDDHGFQAVDALELEGLGVRRAGHARQLLVHAEIVLEGDRRQRLVFLLDRHAFLGLHRLVQALRPAAAAHQAAGEFVDDDDFAVLHHVMLVAEIQRVGTQRSVDVVHQHDVGGVVQAAAGLQQSHLGEDVLDLFMPGFGQQHLARFLVDRVVALGFLVLLPDQPRRHQVDLLVQGGVFFRLPGNDQRRARLVDQDRVDFVDDAEGQRTLHLLLHLVDHVVAQVVEAVFVVGAVGDVGGVRGLLLIVRHLRQVDAGGEAEKAVQPPHRFRVAAGQVVVHRHHVHALAGQRVQIGGQRRHQRLALAGAHLGDLAVVQYHAADHLDVEMAHAEHPLRRFAHHGEGFRQQLVERFAVFEPRLEFGGLAGQLGIGQFLHRRFQRIDRFHLLQVLFDQPVVAAAEDFFEDGLQHEESEMPAGRGKPLNLNIAERASRDVRVSRA